MDSQYDRLGEMLKDAIKSGGIPTNSEKSTGEKISEEKENSAEKRNDEKQNFSQRTAKKEKTNRKNNKKSNIIGGNVQKYIHLYKVFNLNYGCSKDELKESYRKLLKKYHPDNFAGFPETQKIAERKTQELISAFNKLLELIG